MRSCVTAAGGCQCDHCRTVSWHANSCGNLLLEAQAELAGLSALAGSWAVDQSYVCRSLGWSVAGGVLCRRWPTSSRARQLSEKRL